MTELICIVCPRGCHLSVDEQNGFTVSGNKCPRGAEYGHAELTNPTRVVTSTVYCKDGVYPRCPVKTAGAVPKDKIYDIMKLIDSVRVTAPIALGQTIIPDVCSTGVDIVATRAMDKI